MNTAIFTPTFKLLTVTYSEGVDTVVINNPPINLLDITLTEELWRYATAAQARKELRVVIFKSADPDFFIARADLRLFQTPFAVESLAALKRMYELIKLFRTWDKITIGQLEGRASGAGSEFLLALDMRFGALGRSFIRQPEVSLGLIPCKGGTQMLTKLVGRARALEMIISGRFYDAEQLEHYGYLNQVLMPAVLDGFVAKFAARLASQPAMSIALAKQAVNLNSLENFDDFDTEHELYLQVINSGECQLRLASYLDFVQDDRARELSLDQR